MAAINAMAVVILNFIVIILAFIIYALRYKKVPPNMAMVVYGKRQRGTRLGYRVITGGGKFIQPITESYAFLPLNLRTLSLDLKKVVIDSQASHLKVNIKCTAQVKITSDPKFLDRAAEFLLNKTDPEINEIAQKTLEGHLRGECAMATSTQLTTDRDTISLRILTITQNDLNSMGLEIRTVIIEDVQEEDYAKTGQISDEILEKRVRMILEKLLKEKRINLA